MAHDAGHGEGGGLAAPPERAGLAAPAEDGTRERSVAHGAGYRVLVVEDEPSIAEAIRFILRRDGWAVSGVDTGHGAAARIAAERPDLVILDVMLPGPSGLDILQQLRLDPATAHLPVVLLSARGQSLSRDIAQVAGRTTAGTGALLVMSKPFANADLLAAVRQLVGV